VNQELAEAAAYASDRRCVCTYQMAALLYVKWRHGRHLESMTSRQKSYSVNRCVFTWRTILPAKFHPDPIWNDGALGFFEDGRPNNNTRTTRLA